MVGKDKGGNTVCCKVKDRRNLKTGTKLLELFMGLDSEVLLSRRSEIGLVTVKFYLRYLSTD